MKRKYLSKEKKEEKLGIWIICIFFVLLGGLFLFLGVNNLMTINGYIETEATIIGFESYWMGDEPETRVKVSFEANDQQYEKILNYQYAGMHVGQKLIISYDPYDPTKAIGNEGVWLFIGGGAFAIIIAIIFLLANINKRTDIFPMLFLLIFGVIGISSIFLFPKMPLIRKALCGILGVVFTFMPMYTFIGFITNKIKK